MEERWMSIMNMTNVEKTIDLFIEIGEELVQLQEENEQLTENWQVLNKRWHKDLERIKVLETENEELKLELIRTKLFNEGLKEDLRHCREAKRNITISK